MSYRTFTNNHNVTLATRLREYIIVMLRQPDLKDPILRAKFVEEMDTTITGLSKAEVIYSEEAVELRQTLYA